MSFLKSVTKGKVKKPFCVLVYGPDGVGKSTFASQAPDVVFMEAENGTNNIDTSRGAAPKSWKEVMASLKELLTEAHDYKTLAIDSVDWLEPLLYEHVCKVNDVASIEKVGGGYGKGYMEALGHWIEFLRALTALRDGRGMNIVLIGHSEQVREFDAVLQVEVTRFRLKLYKKASEILREYCDAVLFASFETLTQTKDKKTIAISDGTRVVYTDRRHGHDAKNRFGLPLRLDEFSWKAFVNAVAAGEPESIAAVMSRIEGLLSQVQDPELQKTVRKYVEDNRNNAGALAAAEQKLKTVTNLK